MSGAIVTQSNDIRRIGVTIPAAGAPVALLVASVVAPGERVVAFKILGKTAAGADRAAITIASPRLGAAITGTDYSTHGEVSPLGTDYYEPADLDVSSYVKAASDTAATIVVFIA